jgi:outer membrane murein-binding lipoprotein Lpp
MLAVLCLFSGCVSVHREANIDGLESRVESLERRVDALESKSLNR